MADPQEIAGALGLKQPREEPPRLTLDDGQVIWRAEASNSERWRDEESSGSRSRVPTRSDAV